MASAWAQLSKEEQAAQTKAGYNKKSYNDAYGKGSDSNRSEAKSKAQSHINTYTPNAATHGQSAAEIVKKQETNTRALNNDHTPKSNDVGTQAKTNGPEVLRTYDDGRVHYKDGVITADRAKYDAQEAERQKSMQAKYGGQSGMSAKDMQRQSDNAYLEFSRGLQNAKTHDLGQIVDNSQFYKDRFANTGRYHADDAMNTQIAAMVSAGQKFSSADASRGMTRYSQDDYISQDDAQARRAASYRQGNEYYESVKDKYSQYDWFNSAYAKNQETWQKNSHLHDIDVSGYMNTSTEYDSRNNTYTDAYKEFTGDTGPNKEANPYYFNPSRPR